jgi:hypothetical protein
MHQIIYINEPYTHTHTHMSIVCEQGILGVYGHVHEHSF